MGSNKNSLHYSDGMSFFERAIKRLFDVVCSLLGIIFLSPLFLFIYILMRCKEGTPVIFKQERIGRGGKPFKIFKYRTMNVGAADEEPYLVRNNDARLTPLGRFLREYHLDELPQLWNVFKGDMSFVGPRPERKFFIDKIMQHNPAYEYLYLIRPGITSPATIYNGYTDTMEKMLVRLDMDLEYLQRRSLLLDIKVIFVTVFSLIKGKKI